MYKYVFVLALVLSSCGRGSSSTAVGASLIDFGEEPPVEHCALGGTYIATGIDSNDDAVLDADEVAQVSYVCNAAPLERPSLVVSTDEPAGDNCEFGGYKLESGTDDDDDGTLDGEEIDATDYACAVDPGADPLTEIHFGNLSVRSADDLAYLNGLRIITGGLSINLAGDVEITRLERIGGELMIENGSEWGAPIPTTVTLPKLEQVGSMWIGPGYSGVEQALETVSLPALTTVQQGLTLAYASGPYTFDVPVLERVGELTVFENDGLASLSFPALRTLKELDVRNNDGLVAFELPALEQLNEVTLTSNPDLTNCLAILLNRLMTALDPTWVPIYQNGGPSCLDPSAACAPVDGLADFYACDEDGTFAEARALCQSIGDYDIATFESEDDYLAAKPVLTAEGRFYWIGFRDDGSGWAWVVGDSAYTPDTDPSVPDAFFIDGYPQESGCGVVQSNGVSPVACDSVWPKALCQKL